MLYKGESKQMFICYTGKIKSKQCLYVIQGNKELTIQQKFDKLYPW